MNGRVAGIKPPNNNEGHYVSMRRPAFGRDIVLVPGDYTDIDVNMDGSDPCVSKPGILTRFSGEVIVSVIILVFIFYIG